MKDEKKEEFKLHLAELYAYLHKELKLKSVPKVVLDSDQKNADKILGKTGYYDPKKKEIHLFIVERHPKDILRSFSHEVIHHWQHEHEQLEKHTNEQGESDPQYAQHNPWLRQMEKQAYLLGNIMFRDWEDEKKNSGRRSGKKMVQEELRDASQLRPQIYVILSSEDEIQWLPLIDHRTAEMESISDMIKKEVGVNFKVLSSDVIIFFDKESTDKVAAWLKNTYSGVFSFRTKRVQ